MRTVRAVAPCLLAGLTLVLSCTGERSAEVTAIRHPTDTVAAGRGERASVESPGQADSVSLLQPGQLGMVSAAPVTNWAGPGGNPFEVQLRTDDRATVNARPFGTITLRNSARVRSPGLGQYPCTSCHLGRRMVLRDQRIADAHQDIRPDHPVQTGGACVTCHAADNVELLALKNTERATLDHAYRVCAQCHFSQAESWAGGAHGKRLDGWQGRRVVMGCADCHDPHHPALERRLPFRAPQLERPPIRRP